MTTNKVYENDIGTEIKLNAGTSLAGHTVLEIHYLKPDGAGGWVEGIWTATDVETTKAQFITTASGDLSPNGNWKVKIYADLPSGTWWGETVEMKVYDKWS